LGLKEWGPLPGLLGLKECGPLPGLLGLKECGPLPGLLGAKPACTSSWLPFANIVFISYLPFRLMTNITIRQAAKVDAKLAVKIRIFLDRSGNYGRTAN
jgi:hypothetical protein